MLYCNYESELNSLPNGMANWLLDWRVLDNWLSSDWNLHADGAAPPDCVPVPEVVCCHQGNGRQRIIYPVPIITRHFPPFFLLKKQVERKLLCRIYVGNELNETCEKLIFFKTLQEINWFQFYGLINKRTKKKK